MTEQITDLFLLAIPIACVAWTITREEIFREPREYCVQKSKTCKYLFQRKFFYVFTCEYCLSHYVTIFFIALTGYRLLFEDWRGYLIGGFALVWIANVYMSVFGFIRVGMKKEKMDADLEEISLNAAKKEQADSALPAA